MRGRLTTVAAVLVGGLLVLAPGAQALSKHVYSTSFAGSGPSALTNPTDVVVEQSTGDVWVANPPANELQTLEVNATEGTYTLTFNGQTTAPIAPSAHLESIQADLEALSAVGHANVSIYSHTVGEPGVGPNSLTVQFTNDLSKTDVPQLTANTTSLKGGTVQIATVQAGSPVSDVVKFTPAGAFVLMLGNGANQTASETSGSTAAQQDLCTAASGDTCRPGKSGTSLGAFDGEFFDSIPAGGGSAFVPEHRLFLALDETPGGESDLYVADPGDNVVQKFDTNGNPITDWGEGGFLDGTSVGEGKDAGATFSSIAGIAVEPAGDLVLRGVRGQYEGLFYFAQDGAFVSKTLGFASNFGETRRGISIDAAGNLYQTGGEGIAKMSPELEAGANPYSTGANLSLKEIGRPLAGDILGLRTDPATRDLYAMTRTKNTVEHFGPACLPGRYLSPAGGPCAPTETFGAGQLANPKGVSIADATGDAFVADSYNDRIAVFAPLPFLPDASASPAYPTETTLELTGNVDPAGAGPVTDCHFEYLATSAFETTRYLNLSTGGTVPCDQSTPIASTTPVTAELTGLSYGSGYHLRLSVENANGTNTSFDHSVETYPQPPKLTGESASAISADVAEVHALVNPGGGDSVFHTTYRVEYGETESYGSKAPETDAGSARTAQPVSVQLSHLTPNTTYHYRIVATNISGSVTGPDRTFTTFPFNPDYQDTCPNAHVRQQTSSSALLDCRAYELASAADTAGYDVVSDLIAGQTPFGSYPQAAGRVLYGVKDGGIPGTGNPTNRGADPYVATRGEGGWSTRYVGIPANLNRQSPPFSSTLAEADSVLDTFAFSGPQLCAPCFTKKGAIETGVPLRLPAGELIQGMAGPLQPQPTAKADGSVSRYLSADGTHFVFASTSLFAPGGNDETGDVSIYDRNLHTGETHVISNRPGAEDFPEPLPCLQGVGDCHSPADANGITELAISHDGSHILLGQKVAEDALHNPYYHLYMEVDDSLASIDLTPGTSDGVLYAGMTADGSKVFFTTPDRLQPGEDTDESADLYLAEVGAGNATLRLLSTGTEGAGNSDSCEPLANSAHRHWNTNDPEEANCAVVAIGGGGGVASADGTVFFLSPEKLDGSSNGTPNAPNLYLVRPGQGPRYVTTLESVLNGRQPPLMTHTFDHEFGSFTAATGMAVDESTGDLYVLDAEAETVEKFDPAGNPVNFTAGSGAGTNKLDGSDTAAHSFGALPAFSSSLALDQSTGNFYVPDFVNNVIDEFESSGKIVNEIPAILPTSVAVNRANGNLYVAQLAGGETFDPYIAVFTSLGVPVPSASFKTTSIVPDAVAVDPSSGDVYVDQGGEEQAEVVVYDAGGQLLRTLDSHPAHSLAVDPSSGDVYADEGNQIAYFDSSGRRLETFGAAQLTASAGVALFSEGAAYASDGTHVVAFAASLTPGPSIDNPLVIDSVNPAGARHTADFQTDPSGDAAVFPSTLPLLPEADTAGHAEVYRFDALKESLACASCAVTGASSAADASLAADGLSLTDDGRVFFTTADQLATADTDNRKDVYEWEEGGVGNCQSSSPSFGKAVGACIALVSAGTGAFDSGLLGVSADATDAYFFTRDSLAPQDTNGPTMKIYDARVGGGFPYGFPSVACKASDECHGASSPAPGPLQIGSGTLTPNGEPPLGCKKGFVKRHGRCQRRHRRRGTHHKNHATSGHRGAKR